MPLLGGSLCSGIDHFPTLFLLADQHAWGHGPLVPPSYASDFVAQQPVNIIFSNSLTVLEAICAQPIGTTNL